MMRVALVSIVLTGLLASNVALAQTRDPAFPTPRAETCHQKDDGYYCAWGIQPTYSYLCKNGTVVGWRPCAGGCDPKPNLCVRPGKPVPGGAAPGR